MPTDTYVFVGFLPIAKKARGEKLKELACGQWTMIFYESPHRVKKTLAILLETFGNRPAAVVRELTKLHEEVVRGSLEDLVERFNAVEVKGEFTLVVAGGASLQEMPTEQETPGGISEQPYMFPYWNPKAWNEKMLSGRLLAYVPYPRGLYIAWYSKIKNTKSLKK
ncbi:MAG: SAM-dependent methyltransferase [Candidatus Syntrophopropionicum ammoniitolerans]